MSLSYDMLNDVLSDKNIIRTKSFLFVSDLSRKNARAISRKYYLYFLNLGEQAERNSGYNTIIDCEMQLFKRLFSSVGPSARNEIFEKRKFK